MKRPRIDVNLTELDEVLDQARQAPLSEADCNKLKTLLHTLVKLLVAKRRTESACVFPRNCPITRTSSRVLIMQR